MKIIVSHFDINSCYAGLLGRIPACWQAGVCLQLLYKLD